MPKYVLLNLKYNIMNKKQTVYSRFVSRLEQIRLGCQICFSKKQAKSYKDLVDSITSYKKEESILKSLQEQTNTTREILLERLEDRDNLYGLNHSTKKKQKGTPAKTYSKHTESKSQPMENSNYVTKTQPLAPSTPETTAGKILAVEKGVIQ